MKPDRQQPEVRLLPLTMAAVTVAGQCRERSPADLAVFGPNADRFAERFIERGIGEAMLAEAVSDGVAERQALLRTGSGEAPFRIALWRQRGGERIRLLASFSHMVGRLADFAGSAVDARRVEGFGEQLRLPLAAITGTAEMLRRGAEGQQEQSSDLAADILAAAWRIIRLVDDLILLAELGTGEPPLRMSEVDVARLCRRVLRLAQPVASAGGIALVHHLGGGAGPSVLADETMLWSVIENLVRAALDAAGRGGQVSVGCSIEGGDLVLIVEARSAAPGALRPRPALDMTEEMVAANGARLSYAAQGDFPVRLIFPGERCLNPI